MSPIEQKRPALPGREGATEQREEERRTGWLYRQGTEYVGLVVIGRQWFRIDIFRGTMREFPVSEETAERIHAYSADSAQPIGTLGDRPLEEAKERLELLVKRSEAMRFFRTAFDARFSRVLRDNSAFLLNMQLEDRGVRQWFVESLAGGEEDISGLNSKYQRVQAVLDEAREKRRAAAQLPPHSGDAPSEE